MSLCPDDQHPHAVDLGLPSGTKWSCMNVGAEIPEDWGFYFTWGECEVKSEYTSATNKYYRNGEFVNIGSDISCSEYDAAHVCWGGDWCMPNNDQVEELLANTSQQPYIINGVSGYRFSANNGNAIFLPCSGVVGNRQIQKRQSKGFYWTSQQHPEFKGSAYILYIDIDDEDMDDNGADLDSNGRNWGHTIRPVQSK